MDKPVYFTKHAEQKFADLAEIGFTVAKEQVIETIRNPDFVERNADPPIAQKVISTKHLLRVVFVEEDDKIVVVTFYPRAKKRYDKD
jgi:hypothetical protein